MIVQGVYEGLSENVKECKKKGVGYLRLSASQLGYSRWVEPQMGKCR